MSTTTTNHQAHDRHHHCSDVHAHLHVRRHYTRVRRHDAVSLFLRPVHRLHPREMAQYLPKIIQQYLFENDTRNLILNGQLQLDITHL